MRGKTVYELLTTAQKNIAAAALTLEEAVNIILQKHAVPSGEICIKQEGLGALTVLTHIAMTCRAGSQGLTNIVHESLNN